MAGFQAPNDNIRHNLDQELGGGDVAEQRADTKFDASIETPAYAGQIHPSVLFDEAHNNFHTASGRYKAFASLMNNDGYRITSNKDVFSLGSLAGHDIVIIANAADKSDHGSAFTDAECNTLHSWVRDGGGLLVITDHEPYASASARLVQRFGVHMNRQIAVDPAHETPDGLLFTRKLKQLGNHPIMTGRNESERVDRVLTFKGQSLKGPPGSVALLKFLDTAVSHPDGRTIAGWNQGLALDCGKGRVVVMGDAAQLSAQVYGRDPPRRLGMNVPGCDNRKMALNVIHWLSKLISAQPTTSPKLSTDEVRSSPDD